MVFPERGLHRLGVEHTLLVGNAGDAPVCGDVYENRATRAAQVLYPFF